MDAKARLFEIAAKQFGRFTFEQAKAAGLSPRALRRRLQAGVVRRVHSHVVAVAAVPESFEQFAMAATLYAGSDSALGFESAGHLWGWLETPPAEVDIWSPRNLGNAGP